MDQIRDALCSNIEQRLNRIACDATLDPAPEAAAGQVDVVAADLDAAGMSGRVVTATRQPVRPSTGRCTNRC